VCSNYIWTLESISYRPSVLLVCVYVKCDVQYHFNLSRTLQFCVNLPCNQREPFAEFMCIQIHEASPYDTFSVFSNAHVDVQNKINERRGLQFVKHLVKKLISHVNQASMECLLINTLPPEIISQNKILNYLKQFYSVVIHSYIAHYNKKTLEWLILPVITVYECVIHHKIQQSFTS